MNEPFQIDMDGKLALQIMHRIRRALLDQDAALFNGKTFHISLVADDATNEILRAVNEAIRNEHAARELETKNMQTTKIVNTYPDGSTKTVYSKAKDGSGAKFP